MVEKGLGGYHSGSGTLTIFIASPILDIPGGLNRLLLLTVIEHFRSSYLEYCFE